MNDCAYNAIDVDVLLEKVRPALRLTTQAYDEELRDLIRAAKTDLGIAGVIVPQNQDAIITRAVITYCKVQFFCLADGEYDRLKRSYDEQKAQLSTATGYTDWGRAQ